MNTVGYFQRHEAISNKRFDLYEGTETLLRSTDTYHWKFMPDSDGNIMYVLDSGGIDENQAILEIAHDRKTHSEKKLYCMYTLWGDSRNKKFMGIDSRITEEFGEYAAVVWNAPLFLRRIKSAVDLIREQMRSDLRYGFVQYLKKETLSAISPIGIYKKLQEEAAHHNEFRICFDMKNIVGAYSSFQIQNSDICVPDKTDNLVHMVKMDMFGDVWTRY